MASQLRVDGMPALLVARPLSPALSPKGRGGDARREGKPDRYALMARSSSSSLGVGWRGGALAPWGARGVERGLAARALGRMGRRGVGRDIHALAEIILAGLGVAQHFLRPAVTENLAGADHITAVGDLQRFADLVIGDQDGDTAAAQIADN